jgi:hypothetical protein
MHPSARLRRALQARIRRIRGGPSESPMREKELA